MAARAIVCRLPGSVQRVIRRHYYRHLVSRLADDFEVDVRLLSSVVRPGDRVVDVGANIGTYTNVLSRLVGVQGCVFSMEPVPAAFDILRSTITAFGLTNVNAMNCAISSGDSPLSMEVPLRDYGGPNLYLARVVDDPAKASRRIISVRGTSLDALFSEGPRIDFIKCDVEGHELPCLRGAVRVIRQYRPVWLIEISGDPDDQHSPAYHAFEFLEEHGYSAYWFNGASLLSRRPGDVSINYWFLQDEHSKRLSGLGKITRRT